MPPKAKSPAKSRGASTSTSSAAPSKADSTTTGPNSSIDTKVSSHADGDKFEFGGPIGAFLTVILLPLVIYGLNLICPNAKDSCGLQNLRPDEFWKNWKSWDSLKGSLYTETAVKLYLGWMLWHLACERILPGETAFGTKLPDGSKLPYVLSGHLQFWLTLSICMCEWVWKADNVVVLSNFKLLPLGIIYDEYLGLITASLIGATALSIYLYVSSFYGNKILAKGGNTSSGIYNFFIGRELNPRIGSLDLKEFCELRPGLIAWLVINLGMCMKQHEKLGHITLSMALVTFFQGFYVWDALYNERAILTTMDITTDGFGFMLAFGDLAWVPFTYTLQAKYLVDNDPNLNVYQIAVIVLVYFVGYFIFRSANSEKDAFRRDPDADDVKHLQFMTTKRGTKLLTSGWWGKARKINYLGDWLIGLSWCLFCGFGSIVPYFYSIYFLCLLVHRAIRDDEMCHEKYGDDWLEYKKRVPYWFIPGVI